MSGFNLTASLVASNYCPGCTVAQIADYWSEAAQDYPSDGLYKALADRWASIDAEHTHRRTLWRLGASAISVRGRSAPAINTRLRRAYRASARNGEAA